MGRFSEFVDQIDPAQNTPVLDPGADARMREADPDKAAEAQRLAAPTGLPQQTIVDNLDEIKKRETAARFRSFLRDTKAAQGLGDDFNVVAKDDTDTLSKIRDKASNLGLSAALGWQQFKEGAYGLGEAAGTFFGSKDSEFTDLMRVERQDAIRKEQLLQPYAPGAGNVEQGIYSGISSITNMAPGMLLGLVAGPEASLAMSTSNVWGQSYGQAKDQGLDGQASARYATEQAVIEYLTEKIPTHLLFGDIAKKSGLLKTLAHQLVSEVPGEQLATFGQDLSTWLELNPDQSADAFWKTRPAAAIQTLVATLTGTALQTTAVHHIANMGDRAQNATDQEKMLRELGSLAEASKLRERSPEQFKRYMEAVAPDTNIYFDSHDAQSLMQSLPEDVQLDEDLEARIAESAQNDVPLRITAAEYATYFADNHTAQNLTQRARVGSAEAMNAEEAKNIESEFKARADLAISQADNQELARQEHQHINDQVLAQIMSTGRFRSDVASAYSNLIANGFTALASRAGMSAGQLFEQFPLRVQATGISDKNTLDQPADYHVEKTARGTRSEFSIGDVNYQVRLEDPNPMSYFSTQLATEVGQMFGSEKPALELDFGAKHNGQLSEKFNFEGKVEAPNAAKLTSTLMDFAVKQLAKVGDRVVMVRAPIDSQDQRLRIYERALRRLVPTHEVQRLDDETIVLVPRAQAQAAPELNQDMLNPYATRAAEAGDIPEGFTRFRHFGNHDVPVLDPAFQGTGMRGEESKRNGPQVLSLYPDTGFTKESGVGNNEFVVDVPTSQLYDANADQLGLADAAQEVSGFTTDENGKLIPAETRFDMDAFEHAVKAAGYVGYTTPLAEGNMKGQARLFNAVPVVNAKQSAVEATNELFQLKPENEPQGFDAVKPYLTEPEQKKLMKHTAQKLVDVFNSLPKDQDFIDAAKAGEAKKGWYAKAVKALRQVFGEVDAPRFAGLLAALSPQVSVQTNLKNAALVWKAWDAAGRPTTKTEINNVINEALGGAYSVLEAWRNNAVRALETDDPTSLTLSGPKVNSFMRNLMGDMQEVTNDTWMANFAAINQTVFAGSMKDPAKSGPGKRPGYVAYVAKIRRVAEKLGWTPAEVQETIWSWAKTAYELADVAGETRSVEELVRAGMVTDARVAGADDFASMLKNNASIREILEAAGYGDAINAIESEFGRSSNVDTSRAPITPALLRSARRLDEVRRQRAEEAAGRGRTEQQAASQQEQGTAALESLPESSPGPIQKIRDAAQQYVDNVLVNQPMTGPQIKYVSVNEKRAQRIANAYEAALHQPQDFETAVAYDALIDETLAQFQVVKQLGINIEFIKPGQADPYPNGPRQVLDDLRKGHLWVFPTDLGFGQKEAPDHPLLRPTNEVIDGRQLVANDVFRIVHDVFGHGKEGVGFGPTGEENAWQSHVRMYSPLAAKAMTSETRGQNSWVNFGPHGETNRSNQRETVYAEQKAVLLPDSIAFDGIDEASGGTELQQEEKKQEAMAQEARGKIRLGQNMQAEPSLITLLEHADLSTFLHETGHFFFEMMADLAARPNAPAGIQQDMQTLLDWVGFKGTLQEWKAKSIPERRDAHEKFARGFESWLMEGSAPNEEMRGLFHRFRSWLVSIYKSVERLNVTLTPEVRSVMGRMFATEQQIKDTEQARSFMPLFLSQDVSGMSPEEWQQYQETTRAASEHAQDALQARSMKNLRWLDNARKGELRKLQKANAEKRAAVQAEVEAEIAQKPERVAETLLLEGTAWVENIVDGKPEQVKVPGPHKLSIPALEEQFGTRAEYREMLKASGVDESRARAPWEALPRRLLTDGEGLTADQVAEMTGFTSGDQLINALVAMPDRETLVRQMTDQRMMEKYGDLNNPQAMAQAVDLAIHNQHRMRVVSTELAALDESLKTQPGGLATIRRAARDFAAKVIQRAKIRDVKPSTYAAGETRAARDSRALLAAGNLKGAAVRKRDQLFNGYAAKEAAKAQEQIQKGLDYLRKFSETSTRKSLDPSYRDQIDKLLERYDLKRRSLTEVDKRTALRDWIKEQESEGNEPLIPDELVDESRQTNYQNLTVEAFNGLVDAVKNIEHLARLKHKLLAAAEQRDFDQAVTEITTSIEDNAPKGPSKQQLEKDLSLWGRFADTVNSYLTHLRKFASVMRQIDGGEDGGKMWSYFTRAMNAAGDKEVAMRADATRRLNVVLDQLPALQKSFAQRVGSILKGPPKMYIPEIGTSLSLEARLATALNWGNEGNRERVREGNKWTDNQVQAVLDTLTKDELKFVQNVFDFIGSYWSDIAAKEERVTGVRPTRVEAAPITTKAGTIQGGYYPIVADAMRSDKAAQQNDAELIAQSLRGAVSRATTRRGHTKARVGGKDPVRMDLGVIAQHVGQVIHDLSWHETLIDTGKLLRDKRVSHALREHYGAEITRLMRKTLDDVARGEVTASDAGEKIANYFRVGSTVAGLGLSLTTSLMQFTGITQSFVRVGYRHVAGGLMEFTANPAASIKKVREASTFMRDRGLLLNRELGEITNRLDGKSLGLARFYFMPIQAFQTAVDIPTWLGAYNKAAEEGEQHDRAVAIADQAVRDAQGSGATHDLAEAQRGGAWKKLWTNFYSYFSSTYQLSAESVQGFKRDPSIVGGMKMASDFLMLYTVPTLLTLLIREGLRGGLDKDPEKLAEALLKAQLSSMLGVFPYFRELGGVIEGFDYRGPAGASILAQLTDVTKQLAQGENDEALWRAINRAAGTAFHYPAAQVDRTVRGFVAMTEGKAGPQALLVGPPPKEKK